MKGILITLAILLLLPTVSAQYTWTRSIVRGGGGQPGLAVDPTDDNIAYAAGDLGGIYKTTDKGDSWFLIQNNLPTREIASIKIDPLNPHVVYVTGILSSSTLTTDTNGEIYRSLDGGNSWDIVYGEAGGSGKNIALYNWPSTKNIAFPYDPSDTSRYDSDGDDITDVIIVGGWGGKDGTVNTIGNSGVWKSTDEGRTFTQITLNNRNIYFVKFDPNNPDTVYAGTSGDGLYKSTDLGDSWQKVNIPAPNSHLNSMRISDIAFVPGSNTIYLAVDGGYSKTAPGGVYKSTDGGSTWTYSLKYTDILLGGSGGLLVLVDNQDPTGDTVIAGLWRTSYSLYMTTDGGNNWEVQYPQTFPSPPGPSWSSNPWIDPMWAFDQGTDGTFYITTWRGAHVYDRQGGIWLNKANGIGNIVIDDVELDPNNPSTAYFAMKDTGAPFKTTDSGKTWSYINSGFDVCLGSTSEINKVSDLSVSRTDPQVLFATGYKAGGDATTICKSTNGGSSWTPVCTGLPQLNPAYRIMSVEMSPVDNDIVLLATDESKIYRSSNGGSSWTYIQTIPESHTKFEFTNDGQTVVTGGGQNFYVSNNAGLSWSPTATRPHSGLNVYGVDVCPTDKNRIVAGLNIGGAYLSNDQGNTWSRILGKSDIESFPEYDSLALSDYAKTKYYATIRAVQFDSTDCNTIYIGHAPNSPYVGLGLLRTTDSGQNWEIISDDTILESIGVIDISNDASKIIVGGYEMGFGTAGGCTGDPDCPGQICCSGSCVDPVCSSAQDCDDSDSCTSDTCSNPGTCSASCSYQGITTCTDDDGCCPPGCTEQDDNNCGSGIVGHWTFDSQDISGDQALDKSNLGNHGTIHGAGTVTGRVGEALYFDGSDDYVEVISSDSLNVDYLTAALWLKADGFTDNAGFFAKGDNSHRQYWAWIYQGNISMEINEGGFYNYIHPLQTDVWHHLAVTYNGSNIITFINGDEVSNIGQSTGSILSDDDPLIIGRLPGFQYFNGTIDDVMIWNRTLSRQEILDLYNSSFHPADNNPRDGCIEEHELVVAIDDWYYDSTTNTMGEVMEAVTLWSKGTGCV